MQRNLNIRSKMISKNIIQYLLFIILIILSVFFYKKFIEADKNLAQNLNEIQKNNENSLIEENNETSNIIENLRYVSKDLLGNTYIINAQSAEVQENRKDNVKLFEVFSKIIQQNDEVIYIKSDSADYNKINNNMMKIK